MFSILQAEVRQLLSQEVEKAGGQSKWARANGVNRSTVAQVLIGRRDPGPKLLRALTSAVYRGVNDDRLPRRRRQTVCRATLPCRFLSAKRLQSFNRAL